MNLVKKISLFAIFGICFTMFSLQANCYTTSSYAKNPDRLSKFNVSERESILSVYQGNASVLLNDKALKILNTLNIPHDSINETKLVKDKYTNIITYEMNIGNTIVNLDENCNITKIFNHNDLSENSKEELSKYKLDVTLPNTPITYKINNPSDLSSLSNALKSVSNLQNDYELVYSSIFNNDFWILEWDKKLSDELSNPYDSLKVIISRKDGSIDSYCRFKNSINAITPKLNKDEALKKAENILKKFSNIKSTTINLKAVRPNCFWNNEGSYKEVDNVRLSWEICINSSIYIDVDAINGEIIGGNCKLSTDVAKCFGTNSVYGNTTEVSLANSGLSRLSYNMDSPEYDVRDCYDILSYWHRNDAYSFYIACHGSSTDLTDGTWNINISQAYGKWHFVYLDACSTASDDGWARAFNTVGYSGRGFLGWYDDVPQVSSYNFNSYFWPIVGTMSLRSAANQAAAQTPGYTPIRYYGDSNYRGWAW